MWLIFIGSNKGFRNAWPFLFRYRILVNVNIISKSIQALIKNERSVHEWARIDKTTFLIDDHSLYIKDEASIEYLERQSWLTSKYHDLLICDLIGDTHISRDPLRLVNLLRRNLLPHISLDVIHLNSVYNPFLINSTPKRKDILIFERTQSNPRPGYIHRSYILPLIFQSVISLTRPINLVIEESTYNIDETFYSTEGVIRPGETTGRFLLEETEEFIITVTGI